MQPKLEGYALALLGLQDATTLATTVAELGAFDRAILSQPELRAVLTDTALNAAVRGVVVRSLLEGKVNDTTLKLAVYAASHSHAQDVPHAISELAMAALVQSERGAMDLALLGLMAARHRAEGFTDAGLENVATADFARIENELSLWARTIESSVELRRILVDRDAALEQRLGLVVSLLGGKVLPATLALAEYVVIAGRARDIVGTLDFVVDYVAKARDWRVARIHSARPLDDASQEQLAKALSALAGKNVELQVSADATLLGGVIVEVGDLRLDASTKGRLSALHDAVSSGRVLESVLND
jgi:F-type H+-transporting ATPase subunit delta